ncbi:MAG TPA: BrnT family toxin [Thermoanaerobaculia bacterium]|nr:BrnT family toxin [Thermoanaerobaculia bacterium]
MEFEYDEAKSRANLEKHGIDFEAAQELWKDPQRIEIPARTEDEPRSLVVGSMEGKLWSAVVTPREGRTRIISVRRSRDEEVTIYEDIDEG